MKQISNSFLGKVQTKTFTWKLVGSRTGRVIWKQKIHQAVKWDRRYQYPEAEDRSAFNRRKSLYSLSKLLQVREDSEKQLSSQYNSKWVSPRCQIIPIIALNVDWVRWSNNIDAIKPGIYWVPQIAIFLINTSAKQILAAELLNVNVDELKLMIPGASVHICLSGLLVMFSMCSTQLWHLLWAGPFSNSVSCVSSKD